MSPHRRALCKDVIVLQQATRSHMFRIHTRVHFHVLKVFVVTSSEDPERNVNQQNSAALRLITHVLLREPRV